MRRAVSLGTVVTALVLAAAAYAAVVTCDGGRCEGTEADDRITGSPQVDAIYAKGGEDDVDAKAGHDYVRAGDGPDTAHGDRGADTVRGGRGGDGVEGDPGDDHLYGQDGGTLRKIGKGTFLFTETLVDDAPDDVDAVYGGPGYEAVIVSDGAGDDYVDCGADRGLIFGADPGDVVENCDTELPGNARVRLSLGRR